MTNWIFAHVHYKYVALYVGADFEDSQFIHVLNLDLKASENITGYEGHLRTSYNLRQNT